MAEDTNTYTLRRPPDWVLAGLVVLMGGGLGFGANKVAGSATNGGPGVTAHNVQPDAHPAMLSEVSHLEEQADRMQAKLDKVHNNQLVICAALEVDCER